jgi:acetyltransferase EpsM
MTVSVPLPSRESGEDPCKIIIYGGGGHAKALIDLIRAVGVYQLAGIVDDGIPAGTAVLDVPVLGGEEQLAALFARGIRMAVNAVGGIGRPQVRAKVFETIAQAGFTCPSLVHPSAWVEPSARLEAGVQVLAKSYISSDAAIGFGSLINAGVVVSHDCILGKIVNLSPGAMLAGGVVLEDFVQVGMAATINLNIRIGQGARIGNGATVKAHVPAGEVVHAGAIWPPFKQVFNERYDER